MKLTIVTDHRFFRCKNHIYDDYVFSFEFFKTYLEVFDTINVVARVASVSNSKESWVRADGPNVEFIDMPNVHGLRWLLLSSRFFKQKRDLILDTDCFCFRIPSVSAWEVYRLSNFRKPYMFEAIGDPEDAMIASNTSFLKRIFYRALGKYLAYRNRQLVANANVGSYVSFEHLQKKYPVKKGVLTKNISSIRLSEKDILPEKGNLSGTLRLIHVGSFIPLKNQSDLIRLAERLKIEGLAFSLDFVGDGVLKGKCEALARDLGISAYVRFHGQVTGFQNIAKLLDDANVFILPSSNEGMPRAMIEAMARGLICFGSNVGGISELLPKEMTFNPGNISEMHAAIKSKFLDSSESQLYDISMGNINKAKGFSSQVLFEKKVKLLMDFKKNASDERILDSN